MIIFKKIFFISLIALYSYNSFSQPFVDLFDLKYAYYPKTELKDFDSCQASTTEYTADLFLPLRLKSNNIILFGCSYDKLNFSLYHQSSKINSNSDRLYQLSIQAGAIKNFSDGKWNVTLLAIPKISECRQSIAFNKDVFQMGGAVLFAYKKRNSLRFKFGLYYNREFFGNYFMPLAGIDWKVNDRAHLFGVLPGSMNFEYRLTKGFYTGLAFKSNTASYYLDPEHYIREGHTFWGHNMIRNFYQFYITKQLVLFGEIGYTGFRIFDEYNNQNELDNTRFVFQKTNDNFYFNTGIIFRIRLDEEYK